MSADAIETRMRTGYRDRPLRVLVLSWHYPTPEAPQRGLWVERMCDTVAEAADVRVIVPTPRVPPLLSRVLGRSGKLPARERRGDVELFFTRVPGSLVHHTHALDARLAWRPVVRQARALHAERPFDLVHAHFIYPDGVVAARVGQALGIPVMTSEHAFWTPWLTAHPRVGRQVRAALPHVRLVTAVSRFLQEGIDQWVDGAASTAVLPNVVDDRIFTLADRPRNANELLYVGFIRGVKRIDVLLRAIAQLRDAMPDLRLRILSANNFRAYVADRRATLALIGELGLGDRVDVVFDSPPAAVAEAMRRCAFVTVSSSRRETFCSVAAEAIACGTPVVVTRCGGPEEFVTEEDGVMVAPDDPAAFAEGIRRAYARRAEFDPLAMNRRIVERFGRAAWRAQALSLYEELASRGVRRR
jgi:glycosyltransferase involved in cell wall biosynthesis